MKTLKTLRIVCAGMLIISTGAMAMTSKVNDKEKVVYEVLVGDSSQVQGKRSLAVEVKYKSQHVDVGVSSDVNITLNTRLSKGILKVNLRPLKEDSLGLEEENLEFTLSEGTNSFPINFKVASQESGIHYINVTISLEGQGSKVVVIPVNIGTIAEKIKQKPVEKTNKGVAISVGLAEEEIK